MSHTKWHNPNGAMISVLQGYYNPQRYDVNANNEITARDMSILAYHIVNDLPEMLEYISKLILPSWKVPPTSKAMITTILPSKVESSPLKEQMDSKLDPARLLTTTTPRQPSGETADYRSHFGVGNYDVEIAESYRNQIRNTLAEKMFADYQYKNPFCRRSYHRRGRQFT